MAIAVKTILQKATLSHSGIPFISALNIKNKTISSDENLLCMTSQQYDNLRSGKLEKGDIVFVFEDP